MRWQVSIVLIFLATPLLLAGCTTSSEESDIPVALDEGEAYARIYVKRPLGLTQHPIWELEAAPRLVAFIAGDNHTRERLQDEGYLDVAAGWPAEWGEENHTEEEYPDSAVQDWMQPRGLWYEGVVPAGNYSVIRIEIVGVTGKDEAGRPLEIQLMAERLSIGPAEGELFHITPGKAHTFLFESAVERKGTTTYLIR